MRIGALGLVLLSACVSAGPAARRGSSLTLIAGDGRVGTYVSKPWGFSTSSYWIEGPRGLILIDTQFLPSAAEESLQLAEASTGKKVVAAIVLHPNPDKFNGASLLAARDIPVYTSAQVRALIPAVHADRKRSFYERYRPDYPAEAPTLLSFGDRTTELALAGTTLKLHVLGPGCSEAHVVVEWEGHLFPGDLVTNDAHAWLEIGKTDQWRARIQELLALKPKVVHPGRGPAGDEGLLIAQGAYLDRVIAAVAAEDPRRVDDKEGIARAVKSIRDSYPGYGFDVFLDIGVPAEWRRQVEARLPPPAHQDPAVERIVRAALAKPTAWERLSELTDGIGHRLSGSAALDRAIAWATKGLEADQQENVRAEPVMVPHWVRGTASAWVEAPRRIDLAVLALGGSPATPKMGLSAEVLVVRGLEDLERRGGAAKGRIVLFDLPMPPYSEAEGARYGATVKIRSAGPARAAKLGALAALVRSVTARSLRSPHTGGTHFAEGDPQIPAAAISTEDSALIARLSEKGPVRLHLTLGAETLPDVRSANVVGELVGRESPQEIVLVGGHLDSWDVGQGAHDDGAGVVIALESLRVLRELGLRPRRTIRVVLFTNEENGLRGAKTYGTTHAAELSSHVAGIEADTGGFTPLGFDVDAHPEALQQIKAMAAHLAPLGAEQIREEERPGADLDPLFASGIPLLGLRMDGSTYFDYHHSEADTLDKVDPEALQRDVAVVAVMSYLLAESQGQLPRRTRPPPGPK